MSLGLEKICVMSVFLLPGLIPNLSTGLSMENSDMEACAYNPSTGFGGDKWIP